MITLVDIAQWVFPWLPLQFINSFINFEKSSKLLLYKGFIWLQSVDLQFPGFFFQFGLRNTEKTFFVINKLWKPFLKNSVKYIETLE